MNKTQYDHIGCSSSTFTVAKVVWSVCMASVYNVALVQEDGFAKAEGCWSPNGSIKRCGGCCHMRVLLRTGYHLCTIGPCEDKGYLEIHGREAGCGSG